MIFFRINNLFFFLFLLFSLSFSLLLSSFPTSQGPFAPDTEVVASYAFSGTSPEDLPFSKLERLTIVRATNDVNWVKARNRDGMEGMIPTSYVTECRKEVKLNTMA